MKSILATALFLLVISEGVLCSDQFAECSDSNQCGKTQCCLISMERYARPLCHDMRQIGEMCNPYSAPKDTMVAHPSPKDGYLNLTNIYETLCPCASGLVCSMETSQCELKKNNRKIIKKIMRKKSS